MMPSLLDTQLPRADRHEIQHGQIASSQSPGGSCSSTPLHFGMCHLNEAPGTGGWGIANADDVGRNACRSLTEPLPCWWPKLVPSHTTRRGLVASWPWRWQWLMSPQTGKTKGPGTNCSRAIPRCRSKEITLHALRGRDDPSWVPLS